MSRLVCALLTITRTLRCWQAWLAYGAYIDGHDYLDEGRTMRCERCGHAEVEP